MSERGRILLLIAASLASGCLQPPPKAPAGAAVSESESPQSDVPQVLAIPQCAADREGPSRLVVRMAQQTKPLLVVFSLELYLDGVRVLQTSDLQRLSRSLDVIYDAPAAPGLHEAIAIVRLKGLGNPATNPLRGYAFEMHTLRLVRVDATGTTCTTAILHFKNSAEPMPRRLAARFDTVPPDAELTPPSCGPKAPAPGTPQSNDDTCFEVDRRLRRYRGDTPPLPPP